MHEGQKTDGGRRAGVVQLAPPARVSASGIGLAWPDGLQEGRKTRSMAQLRGQGSGLILKYDPSQAKLGCFGSFVRST